VLGVDLSLEAETIVGEFRQCIMRGRAIGKDAPELLKRILDDGYWRRPDKNGTPFKYVEQFIQAAPLPGLGSDVATVKRIVRDDPEALSMLDEAMKETERRGATEENVNNVNELPDRPQGNSRQQALRRLRGQRPDLHTRVLSGELSPHAAMVEAGFREKTHMISADPDKAAEQLRRHFEGARLRQLIKKLTE
jgi:hypothetical protein